MTFRNLDKWSGFFLSVTCIVFYWLIFQAYNRHFFGAVPPLSSWSTRFYLVGVLIHMMYIIPAGETATLTFGAKNTETVWNDGLAFVPNIFHFTISAFNFAVLWGLSLNSNGRGAGRNYIHAEVFTHQMMPQYHRTTQMGKVAADVDRLINGFGFWLLGWKNGEPHLVLMRFGFRLMVIGYILATVTGTATIAGNTAAETANRATTAANAVLGSAVGSTAQFLGVPPKTEPGKNAAQALIAYCDTARPIMPLPEFFTPSTDEGKAFYQMIDNDPRKYFQYAEAPPGKTYTGWVQGPSCYTVPPGREILFMSRTPPRCAVNMEPEAHFKISERGILFLKIQEVDITWFSLNNRWWDISKDAGVEGLTNFKAKAVKMSDLPPGSFGGIVCF